MPSFDDEDELIDGEEIEEEEDGPRIEGLEDEDEF